MSLIEKLFAGIQYLLPHHLLSRIVHRFMRIRIRWIKNFQIFVISEAVGVDWTEARSEDYGSYANFNEFFTRELKDNARPIHPDPKSLVSPCDGHISQCGRLTGGTIFQAKNHHFSLRELLANDPVCAALENGWFHNIYLSPRDYHRVHMPASGHLQRMIHVPGRLFSVSPGTVRQVPNLFARNERVVSIFDTEHGPMAIVLVGAMLVSSMDTVWAGTVNPPRARRVKRGDWSRNGINLERGAEMGRFNMGSTVITVLPPNALASTDEFEPGDPVVLGLKLGRFR